jgi:hypothetical protein
VANLFSKVIEKLVPKTQGEIFEITCAADWDAVPRGFFKIGDQHGYKTKLREVYLNVGHQVRDGRDLMTLEPEAVLPTVVLKQSSSALAGIAGVQHAAGQNFVDTENMPGAWDGDTKFDGDPRAEKLADINNGLW